MRRWVTFHGVSLNVAPDLGHFSGIVPCGIAEPHFGVTSLADLGRSATLAEVDDALRASFETTFGPVADVLDAGLRRRVTMGPSHSSSLAQRAFWSRPYALRRFGTDRAAAARRPSTMP